MQISVSDAEDRLDELVSLAEAGEDIVLTLDGEPVVRLVRITDSDIESALTMNR